MNNITLWSKIRDLSRTEHSTNQYLAQWIIDNKNLLLEQNLEQFCKLTNCSKPTIMRFCNSLDISGWSELKFRIETIVRENKICNIDFTISNSEQDENEAYQDILRKTQLEIKNPTTKEQINEFVEAIKSHSNIYVFAMNLGYNVCKNFVQRLHWLNKFVILENDLNTIDGYINSITNNDLVILVSLSGNSKHISQFVNLLENKNVYGILGEDGNLVKYVKKTISIPQFEHSFWDSYSIRGQALIQILDYIFIGLIKKL